MKHFEKTCKDFLTKLEYHEYLEDGLYDFLNEEIPDIELVKECPPNEP